MAADYLTRWNEAKAEFERITGVKKASKSSLAGGLFGKGLTPTLKTMDKSMTALDKAVSKGEAKAIASAIKQAEKDLKTLQKVAKQYMSSLEKMVKDEVANHDGEKSTLSKGLKSLKAEVDKIAAVVEQKIDGFKITQGDDSTEVKVGKMLFKALKSATKVAIAAIKKIKSDPSVETWRALMNASDPPGRKMHVQIQTAVRELQAGRLPALKIDPSVLRDRLEIYKTPTSEGNNVPDDATPAVVLRKLEDFRAATKLVVAYCDELNG